MNIKGKTMTNREIQASLTGMVQKTCWSMLWQNKELYVSDLTKKGYKESATRKSFNFFVDKGWAVKPEGTHNYIKLSGEVTK